MNKKLRKEVKLLKAMQNIGYKEISEYLEISSNSFYNWLCGYYDFGTDKQNKLKDIIETIKEY